jgi:hypothetical protein
VRIVGERAGFGLGIRCRRRSPYPDLESGRDGGACGSLVARFEAFT